MSQICRQTDPNSGSFTSVSSLRFLSWIAILSIVGSCGVAMTTPASAQGHAAAQRYEEDADDAHAWRFWGGNLEDTHSSAAEHSINTGNVHTLTTKWAFTTAGDVSATPTIEGKSLYVPDWGGFLYKIDTETGKAMWSHKVSEYTGNANSLSRNSPAIGRDRLIFGDQAAGTVIAVDKMHGSLLWTATVDTSAGAVITSSPLIVGDRVYVGVSSSQEALALQPGFVLTFRGSIVCLDLYTGHILWQTYTVPIGYTGGAVWGGSFAFDQKRNSLYVTSGNNYSVPDAVNACIGKATTAADKLACLDPQDLLDAMLSLDPDTGKIKWSRRLEGVDTFTVSCVVNTSAGIPCPDNSGPDFDFGSAANLFTTEVSGRQMDVIGAGQKSGVYWALNPDNGAVLWGSQVGPGGTLGGIEWGTASDGRRVYTEVNNNLRTPFLLGPQKTKKWSAGSWAALDAVTGNFVWQVPATGQNPLNPALAAGATGQVTEANGVFYAGSLSGDMVALDAANGELLWKFPSGGSVVSGPSIVDGTIYWGSGYRNLGVGTGNNKLYAFSIHGNDHHGDDDHHDDDRGDRY
jgi:polyvinyl alcohol dehydrogenase (cytochrome)